MDTPHTWRSLSGTDGSETPNKAFGRDAAYRAQLISTVIATEMKSIALRVLEIILFCVAFAVLIPPPPSHEDDVYSLIPPLLIGAGLLTLSMLLAHLRKAENMYTSAIKLLFFVAYGWLLHQRVWGF